MTIRLTATGKPSGLDNRLVAKVTRSPVECRKERRDLALILSNRSHAPADLQGYAVILSESPIAEDECRRLEVPVVHSYGDEKLGHLQDQHIVAIDPRSGFTRAIFRPESPHNTIFATERCNSNCLMCSQPPKDVDDSYLIDDCLRMISLIDEPPEMMGITGGEPTLLKDKLPTILTALKEGLPSTFVHMLTNGRLYCYSEYVRKIAEVRHPAFMSAIPLYSDDPQSHDYVVQADGAFDQTVEGLYNAATFGLSIEIRVVLHLQTVSRLPKLAEFIYRNFPFVEHVALMGLENMGYVKKNWNLLWVDPVEYQDELAQAVSVLNDRGMNVSIYNLQLCLLPKALWPFARKSISDFKNIYLDVCDRCDVKADCAGLFASSARRHSAFIKPVAA